MASMVHPAPRDVMALQRSESGHTSTNQHPLSQGFPHAHPVLQPRIEGSPLVSVVLPALNEEKNIPHVLASLPDDLFEIVLVDGNSSDNTVAVARARHARLRVVQQRGKGKGAALRSGYAAARGDIIVTVDADGSMDGAEVRRFVQALVDGADFAKGSRFLPGGGSTDITRLRRYGNTFLTYVANLLHGTAYTDITYGYNAFWSSFARLMDVQCDGFAYEILINCRIARMGLAVREVPSIERPRLYGASKLNALRDGWAALQVIVRERFIASFAGRDERLAAEEA